MSWSFLGLVVLFWGSVAVRAQEPAPVEPAAVSESSAETAATPIENALEPREKVVVTERDRFLPRLDLYFPEGDLDLRINRLVNKVFFEGQVKYNFIDGDITAFLRYRYYGAKRISQFAVFDAIEFDDFEKFSEEFDRVRGLVTVFQWPHSVHHRTYLVAEADRIASSRRALRFNNNTTNTYVRLGYQVGTGQDARSNAIVGETRARSERLFTAGRDIGPGQTGWTIAATYSDPTLGDYEYIRLETEALKRFDVSAKTFVVGRVHAGSFPYRRSIERQPLPGEPIDEVDRFSIPRAEYFRLDGRENLKGVGERLRGTHEIHTSWEYFFPWFQDQSRRALRLDWETWYWVLYVGAGNIGFTPQTYREFGDYIGDAGVGFEASFRLRKYRFFLSGIVAQAFEQADNPEVRLSLKSYH